MRKLATALAFNLFREDALGTEYLLRIINEDEDNSKAQAEEIVQTLIDKKVWPKGHTAILRGPSTSCECWRLTKQGWEEL